MLFSCFIGFCCEKYTPKRYSMIRVDCVWIPQYIFRYIYVVDVIKRCLNLAWWNNGLHVLFLCWLYTCTSRSCSWSTGKSILGVSVAVTSGSHLFVKDLVPFKLLFPFSGPVLYTKLSCHWWHQMTSIIVYGLRSKDGLQYTVVKRTVLSHLPPQSYQIILHAIRMSRCLLTYVHTFYIQKRRKWASFSCFWGRLML